MPREILDAARLRDEGLSPKAVEWAVKTGKAHRVVRGHYLLGENLPSELEVGLVRVAATSGIVSGDLAGRYYRFDAIDVANISSASKQSRIAGTRRLTLLEDDVQVRTGMRITSPERTLIELASRYSDDRWEQVLESALRMNLITTESLLGRVKSGRSHGNQRVRRVLNLRGMDTPPTESLLETLAVQLLREDPRIPDPVRQYELRDNGGEVWARIDLAFPDHGVCLELDGKWHEDQPEYDANRQTRITAATGWLVGRFVWADITKYRQNTLRRVNELLKAAARLPSVS